MSAFGADVVIVPSDGGRITPELFDRMRERVHEIVDRTGAFWTDQFHNADALDGYADMGREMSEQSAASGVAIDVLCAGVGTAGMLVGVVRGLRESGNPLRVVALEPSTSPMLTAGRSGPHRVEGIATGIVPPLLRPDTYDEARVVDEAEARRLAIRLGPDGRLVRRYVVGGQRGRRDRTRAGDRPWKDGRDGRRRHRSQVPRGRSIRMSERLTRGSVAGRP